MYSFRSMMAGPKFLSVTSKIRCLSFLRVLIIFCCCVVRFVRSYELRMMLIRALISLFSKFVSVFSSLRSLWIVFGSKFDFI